jgi:hypothetical protein
MEWYHPTARSRQEKNSRKGSPPADEYKNAKKAVDALGGRKDNGVMLKVGDPGPGKAGSVEISPNQAATADNPNGQNISVTLTSGSFDGSVGSTLTLEHEGSHVADASNWIATGFNPSSAVNFYGTEVKAYSVEASFAEAFNFTDQRTDLSGHTYTLWSPASTPNTRAMMIRSILWNGYIQLGPGSRINVWQNHTRGGH